jgi:ATP-binding cassette subfamily B protein
MSAARATSCGTRLFEILDIQPEIADKPGAAPLAPTKGVLKFEHVDFGYEDGAKLILHDISFEVGQGQTLGIVGPPGSGKSTIANLVPRFYDVTSGAITIDGVDIRDVTLASLREYVGLVQQEAFLFDSTVTNNVAYADPWAEEARIVGATRTAQLHDYIAGLPGGYGTRVGERGVALSGGQRQRMSIARGVVPGPGIMIFDDSTAAIDAVTEKKVRDALAHATRQKATIIIAHRLSSLMHADEILVLEEGRVVERGNHEQLLALRGEYYDLYQLQTRTEQGLSIADQIIHRRVSETAEVTEAAE